MLYEFQKPSVLLVFETKTQLKAVLQNWKPPIVTFTSQYFHHFQFIYRGTNTYQLKFGPLKEKQSNSLCNNDRLDMMDAPMVYYHTVTGYWEERRNINSTYKVGVGVV